MKISKKIVLMLASLAVIAGFMGCGLFIGEAGEVPRSEIGIPDALVADADSRTPGTIAGLFEPFRASLSIADDILNNVNEIIDAINTNIVPNFGSVTLDSGEVLTFSTDSSRTYTKRIEVTQEGASEPGIQINYTPGSTEGVLYFREASPAAGELEVMKVYYNATTANPVLKGWLTVKDETSDSYAKSLYFNVTRNNAGNIEIEGGVNYNFVWGTGDTTYPIPYTSERTYMYKSYADSAGTKALTGLYFPLSSVTAVTEAHNIQQSFLEILYNWLNANSFDYLGEWDQDITSQTEFNTFVLNEANSDTIDPSLAFILDLTNPIAFNSTVGYAENGDDVTSEYTALGELDDISFSLSPADISALEPDSTVFTFLAD